MDLLPHDLTPASPPKAAPHPPLTLVPLTPLFTFLSSHVHRHNPPLPMPNNLTIHHQLQAAIHQPNCPIAPTLDPAPDADTPPFNPHRREIQPLSYHFPGRNGVPRPSIHVNLIALALPRLPLLSSATLTLQSPLMAALCLRPDPWAMLSSTITTD